MNKITAFLLIIIMTLCFSLGATMQGKAQIKTFAGVVPFITSNNRLGFFDQMSGKIYLYDDNFGACVFSGQLTALGQPIMSGNNSGPTGTVSVPNEHGNTPTENTNTPVEGQ